MVYCTMVSDALGKYGKFLSANDQNTKGSVHYVQYVRGRGDGLATLPDRHIKDTLGGTTVSVRDNHRPTTDNRS